MSLSSSTRRRPPPSLLLLLLFSLLLSSALTPVTAHGGDEDDFQELMDIDREVEAEEKADLSRPGGEAEVLRRAQRVILELTNENARKVVDRNPLVLLLGYTPWCPRSADLMPRFAQAALALKEMGSPVLTAKIDAERYGKAAGQLGVRGYPTILLFVNRTAMPYTGGLTGEEIVIWARKKTGYPVVRLSSAAAAEEFVKQHQIYIVGLFEKYEGPEYEEFVKAASSDNEIQFVEVQELSIAKVLFPVIASQKHFMGLVKSEPERFEKFEDSFEEQKILQFIQYNKFPLVTTLTELNSASVYSSPMKLQIFIFAEADDLKHHQLAIQDVARKYKSKVMFVYVDSTEDNLAKPFLTLFGLEAEKPIVTAFDNRIGDKYLLESDLTSSNLKDFCSGLLRGTLSPYFKSEPIPAAGGLIEKIVGRTFDASVLSSDENVFLEVYTPWCIDCEATSKQVEKLAKLFSGQNKLKFARIDASLNEHPKLQIDNFPTLLFYPAGDKANPIKISKKSNMMELATFIRENARLEDVRDMSSNEQVRDEL